MGKYSYKPNEKETVKDSYIYQSSIGSIILVMGGRHITLTKKQIDELYINLLYYNLYSFEDFDIDLYRDYYNI